jgi:hypothetical protein
MQLDHLGLTCPAVGACGFAGRLSIDLRQQLEHFIPADGWLVRHPYPDKLAGKFHLRSTYVSSAEKRPISTARHQTSRALLFEHKGEVTPAAELIYWRSDGFTSLKAHPCGAEQTCPIQLARSQIAKWQEGWALLGLTQWRVRTLPMHK